MKPHLFIVIPLEQHEKEPFEKNYVVHYAPTAATRAPLFAESASKAQAVLASSSAGLTGAEIQALPNLEIICIRGAGADGIDVAAARERGVAVVTGAGTNAASVADHAMALLFSAARGIVQHDRAVHDGQWKEAKTIRPVLTGKRLGILGLGHIGKRIAARSAGFEMKVGYNTRRRHEDVPYQYFDTPLALAEWSDFLIVACPGGEATYHIVDAKVLQALGPGGYLVNIARGSIVDTPALLEALARGTIAGAALDVIEDEDKALSPEVLQAQNLLITPHVAYYSPEAIQATLDLALVNLDAHFAGKALTNAL